MCIKSVGSTPCISKDESIDNEKKRILRTMMIFLVVIGSALLVLGLYGYLKNPLQWPNYLIMSLGGATVLGGLLIPLIDKTASYCNQRFFKAPSQLDTTGITPGGVYSY